MIEIKFRAWDSLYHIMTKPFSIYKMNFTKCDNLIPLQFTGLLDKNGVEIYECDIVHQPFIEWVCTEAVGTIVFKHGKFLFIDNEGKSSFSIQSNVEVIGNIYENGDLLK